MVTTRSRPRGREHVRPSSGGVTAEHATKIYIVGISAIVLIVAFLALTSVGHVIDAATQHFMLFYAGVFALIALCASVVLGLIATDRAFLTPGRRVLMQSAHRAASFGAVTFLLIHIVTEILAQRVHVLDAVVPFLSPFRTFYIGLGTIASDLIILLVITGIMRGRFNANGKAWRWRAIHYTSYLSFAFGVWHGLLAGRTGRPYVDWSYGLVVALVAIGLAVRIISRSLRPRESLSPAPGTAAGAAAAAPMRAAAMLAQARMTRGAGSGRLVLSGSSAPGPSRSGFPALAAPAALPRAAAPPLGAPVSGLAGTRAPYAGAPAGYAPAPYGPAPYAPAPAGQVQAGPRYEPGYEGPARYLGAPRDLEPAHDPGPATGPQPFLSAGPGTGPQPRRATGPQPRMSAGSRPRPDTGPLPREATGPFPRAGTGPFPGTATGPFPQAGTGPFPRAATGPQAYRPGDPTPGPGTDPYSRPGAGPRTGPQPRAATGPQPRPGAGGRPATGPIPRAATGPIPRGATGPVPRAATGPLPAAGNPLSQPAPAWEPDGRLAAWGKGAFPEPDPDFRYREPGPGMPGYRGSRDHRYGGDVRR